MLISRHNILYFLICNLTQLQDGNTSVKFLLGIEKIHVGSETNWKVGSLSRSEKIIPDPQHCS
jgi:hypothetical protein